MIIAGTGHRPQYCPCKFDESHPWLEDLKMRVSEWLDRHQPTAVISGMAIGWDTWLAQVAQAKGIPVWAYVPFKNQGSKWPPPARLAYNEILRKSEIVTYLSDEYYPDVFLARDRAMVEDADYIYSLLNPEAKSGGTYYTVQYAKKQNKTGKNFWRDYGTR